jgi:hypothetical protein
LQRELHDQAELTLAQQWLDASYDPGPAADYQVLSDFERLLTAHVTRRDHLLPATQLVAILDAGHGATIRSPADIIDRRRPATSCSS